MTTTQEFNNDQKYTAPFEVSNTPCNVLYSNFDTFNKIYFFAKCVNVLNMTCGNFDELSLTPLVKEADMIFNKYVNSGNFDELQISDLLKSFAGKSYENLLRKSLSNNTPVGANWIKKDSAIRATIALLKAILNSNTFESQYGFSGMKLKQVKTFYNLQTVADCVEKYPELNNCYVVYFQKINAN